MDRIKLKNDAKADVRGKVWLAFQPFAVLLFVEYGIGIFSRIADNYETDSPAFIVFTVIYAILSFLYAVFNFPINVGIARYFISFTRGEYRHWVVIFDSIKNPKQFWNQFFANLLVTLMTALGMVCLIVPGIYIALRYSQTVFIFAENPDMGWKEAMKRSWDMMKDHTWEYFVLVISFFGWWIVVGLTFGIASIYVDPYEMCAKTRYYRSLSAVSGYDDDVIFTAHETKYGKKDDNPFAFDFDDDDPFNVDEIIEADAILDDDDDPFDL